MATEEILRNHSFPAGADLSAAQFLFVKLNSSGQIILAGAGEDAIGILQDKPAAAGRAGAVGVRGRSKVVFGGTVAIGAYVTSDAAGKAVTAGSGEKTLGICVEGGAADTIGSVLLDRAANPA